MQKNLVRSFDFAQKLKEGDKVMKIPQGVTLTKLEGMDPAAARKLIAQDALLWLKLEKVSPTQGVYIGFEATTKDDKILYEEGRCRDLYELTPDGETFAHTLVEQIPEEALCKVCALGLTAIASVCRFNEVKAADLPADAITLRRYLQKYFPIEQLYMMECAFEGWDAYTLFSDSNPPPKRADARLDAFRWEHPGAHERLVAIFQNIVDNNGEFNLPDAPVSGYFDDDEDPNEGSNLCCPDSGTELCACESEDEPISGGTRESNKERSHDE